MKIVKTLAVLSLLLLFTLVVASNIWGAFTLGTITPEAATTKDKNANRVTMVFGATGSVGDGLLKAAIEDPGVKKIYAVTRRASQRIDAGIASGKVEIRLLKDFTDYSSLTDILGEVNTVLWGLGTSSFNVDDATFTTIHVDFPVAFVRAWLSARTAAPMSFHYVTGMGTDAQGSAHWAREKGRAEHEVAALAQNTGLRTFGYRSAFIRPTSEQANILHYALEVMLKPGGLVITSKELGGAMLEIGMRTDELKNGILIDNADSIAYAILYEHQASSQSL